MHKKRVTTRRGATKRHQKPKEHWGRRIVRFVPALLLFAAAYSIHTAPVNGGAVYASTGSVLAYATSMNITDLYNATNAQRSANGVASLNLQSQLNAAAQAKANDMAARNYWSHNTPEGNEPWVFFSAAGYNYTTAGENLAYGFTTSADTITGWMNSPPHKANLLHTGFKDVGFGFANSENYQGNGQQTIIVAMYGASHNSQPASAPPATTQPTSTPPAQTKASAGNAPAPAPEAAPTPPVEPASETPVASPEHEPIAADTTQPVPEAAETAAPAAVKRIQILTGGNANWSSGLLVASLFGMVVLWGLQRGMHVKRYLVAGENLLFRHMHFDMTVLSFLALGYTLLQTTGTVR